MKRNLDSPNQKSVPSVDEKHPYLWQTDTGIRFATIPAGPFIYGPEETYERLDQAPPPRPRQTIELETFHLAVVPVTYAQWKVFLDNTGFGWKGEWWAVDH